MEFVQFHPTGMVWPPSVRGILVTEGVRGEGGVLRNNNGERFMFSDIPENYATRPPRTRRRAGATAPATRTRCGRRNCLPATTSRAASSARSRKGGGSPHGGVFLDIAWIKEKIANAPDHIKRKLPSMYHQFKELGNIDITKEPMEVGPTTHYMMGGVRVDGDSQMSSVPGLFAAGECGGGLHGANRLGGNSLSDLLVFGKRAGEFAAKYAKDNPAPAVDPRTGRGNRQVCSGTVRPPRRRRRPLPGAACLAKNDAGPGRHRPQGRRNAQGAGRTGNPQRQAAQVCAIGNREYNPGWHTALDLENLLTVSEATTRASLLRKESRGAQFREDFPDKSPELAKVTVVVRKGGDGKMQVQPEPIPEMPAELKQIIEEMK